MAKKKKTQLKPVARGFAVTSMPKKTIQVDENQDESSTVASESHNEEKGSPATECSANANERDSVSPEEQALQNLVDTMQEKTEKEISRYVLISVIFSHANGGIRNVKVLMNVI
jgi:ATP-dependent RNA helicase DHX29